MVATTDGRRPRNHFKRSAIVILAAVSGFAAEASDELTENGMVRFVQSHVQDYSTIEHGGETVTGGSLNGTSTVIESTGGPFVEGAVSRMVCIVFAQTSEVGVDLTAPCTITDGEGDQLYVIAERDAGSIEGGGGGQGRFEITGGTGKFADLQGDCPYETEYLKDVPHVVTRTECNWHRVSR